jgi:hypothetical protein
MRNVHWCKHASKSIIRLKNILLFLVCIAEGKLDILETEIALILHSYTNIRLTISRYLLDIVLILSTYMEYSPTSECNELLHISSSVVVLQGNSEGYCLIHNSLQLGY